MLRLLLLLVSPARAPAQRGPRERVVRVEVLGRTSSVGASLCNPHPGFFVTLKKLGFGATVVFAFALGAFMRPSKSQMASPALFNQVFKLVSTRFVDSLDTSALYDRAARGLVEELHDPYADLYDPDQLKEFAVMAEGRYAGVGMLVEDQNGAVVVSRVFPHTPAEEAGIQEGDHIVGLDGQSTSGWSLNKVTAGLKGPEGTQVTATFSRPGSPAPIVAHFTRRIIHIPAVPFATVLPGGVGYIPLQQFNETAGEETANAVRTLTAQGARGIVLDMRGNGGGLVSEAVKVANLFLPQGAQVAAQRERGREPLIYVAREQPLAPTTPLIVLVDSTSASATEIVTGALQDHDRALVIGTRTFGKGLVQSVFDLDDGYALKLTTGKWFTPSGRSIHRDRVMLDGRLVVDTTHADSVKTAAERAAVYHSDSGRRLFGGGGIVPDVTVRQDTLTLAEQKLVKDLLPKSRDLYLAIYKYGWELKSQVKPDFTVTPAMREALRQRLQTAGVQVPAADWQAGGTWVDRLLGDRIARFAFGDSTALRREYDDDAQLVRAVDMLRRGPTQQALFALANGVKPQS